MLGINPLEALIAYIDPRNFKTLTYKQKFLYPILAPIFLSIIIFFFGRYYAWLFCDTISGLFKRNK